MTNHQLDFATAHTYPDKDEGITLPVLLGFGGKTVSVEAKVDTGAGLYLFRREHGEKLGLGIESGEHIVLDTLAGSLEAFGHEITLQSCGIAFQSFVYLARYPGLRRNILGLRGWFRNMRVGIVDYDHTICLSRYDD